MMMAGLRKAGQSWLGRIVVGIMFGFLILSFAIWGIGDMLRTVGVQSVARVGSTDITATAYRDAYQTELQQLSRRARRAITNEEARTFGLDRQILNKMISETVLDQKVQDYGLAISDETIAKAIFADPNFKGASGAFDRNLFNELIRNNGYTEQGFVKTQRAVYLRQQLADSLAGAMPAPALLRDAVHRYQNETRAISYFVVGAGAIGAVPAPEAAALQSYFDQNKARFRAPEYRKLTLITLSAGDIAKPESVSEADARAFYDANKARYGQPERRAVQQIVFPSADEAKAAAERIAGGLGFDALAAERKLDAKDVDLGLVTRDGIVDPKVAETAFGLAAGAVSPPVEGRFGWVLVRVASIEPESVKPFESVSADIRRELATSRARANLQTVHDKIEDQRASARPLAEIAKDQNLPLRTLEGVDRSGRDKAGKVVDLSDRDALLKAVFASDIGVDNEAVANRDGGWTWFEIAGIEASRDRQLDEVKAEVTAAWTAEETAAKVADKAAELLKAVKSGTALADVAATVKAEVKTAAEIKRGGAQGLSAATVNQVFSVPVGEATTAIGASPQERVVLKVDGATVPQLLSTTQAATQLDEQLRLALSDDVLTTYIARAQSDLGVRINETILRQAVGGNL